MSPKVLPPRTRRTIAGLFLTLTTWSGKAAAQQQQILADSTRAQIQTGLRAFYFNLAHRDWDALTADILPAKVVAHRPAPEVLLTKAGAARDAAERSTKADDSAMCPAGQAALVDQAGIILDGDWAEVSVPRCGGSPAGADEFRLIRFESRWRLVYIRLFQQPVNVSTDR
ncbi:MAG TPA: hypothetical protein VHR41_11910 [Gemmatimonadales bacterium]|jgi:hypothetical protein|nr:hypothetical protein [Gemmatimonadales bacterium]